MRSSRRSAQAVVASGCQPGDVSAIALSGILCGPVFVDSDWRPVRPIIPFLDVRAGEEVAWLANEVEPRWVTESANSTARHLRDAGGLRVGTSPRTRGVRAHRQDPVAGSLRRRVSRRLSAPTTPTPTLRTCRAGSSGGTPPRGRCRSAQLESFGIPAELAPSVRAPWDVVGGLTTAMAERCGLAPGTPICAGAGDVMQSNLGAGLIRPGMATDVAGTASILTVGVTAPSAAITAVPGMLYSLGTLPGQALYWGYVKAGGLSLRWFRDEVLGRRGDDGCYAEGDRLAAAVAPGSRRRAVHPVPVRRQPRQSRCRRDVPRHHRGERAGHAVALDARGDRLRVRRLPRRVRGQRHRR